MAPAHDLGYRAARPTGAEMAIDETFLRYLKGVLDLGFSDIATNGRRKAICLAYPDLLVPQSTIIEIIGPAIIGKLQVSPRDSEIREWHHLPESFGPVVKTESVFETWGLPVEFIDIQQARGQETIVDLNEPLPAHMRAMYDLVVDTGTMEHCFNVGEAFKSMCALVKAGGYIISMAPVTIFNHGYWNFNPCAFWDGLGKNGFKILELVGRTKDKDSVSLLDFKPAPAARSRAIPSEMVVICIAKRLTDQPFKWPFQDKYAKQAAD